MARKADAPERERLMQVSVGLPADLVAELDRIAKAELRSRGRLVEMLIREALQRRQSQTTRRVA
jgi:metal-responsive CopG/Arc/MetJ family transcriptional regulator